MTEAQAWTKLAKWFAADQGRQFICNVLRNPFFHRIAFLVANPTMANDMVNRIDAHMDDRDFELGATMDVWIDEEERRCPERSSSARVMFCLFMAMECEEEATS